MIKEKEIIEKIEKRLKEILGEIPFISTKKSMRKAKIFPEFQVDMVLEIFFNNRERDIIIEVRSVGEPRYVRSAVQKLVSYLKKYRNAYGVIAAPYISERTGEICKEANIGYIDLSGNCFLSFDTIYIKKENYESIVTAKKKIKNLFSKKTSRLLRVLLISPKRKWTQVKLSKESKVSIGLTNRAIKKLYNLEYIDYDEDKKISLKNPTKLLDLWREKYTYLNNKVVGYYSALSKVEFEMHLIKYISQRKKERYAFTLFSGASLIAPFVRSHQTFFYFTGNEDKLIKELELKQVTTGPNVLILIPYDEGVFYRTQKIRDKNVVSNIQLYLDLFNYKGRGKEQAEYLREKVIKF